jgi:hypothetical protein
MKGLAAARKKDEAKTGEQTGNMRELSGALSCVARVRAALM